MNIFPAGVGGGTNNFSTMHYNVDGPVNSLSTSKDGCQVVVAGRSGRLMSYAFNFIKALFHGVILFKCFPNKF